jgi:hypothetical protein
VRSQRTRELSWIVRWKLRDGVPEEEDDDKEEEEEVLVWGWGRGGVKWEGEAERVVQDGSEDVSGAPLRSDEASKRDWERRRSWAERNCGGGRAGGGGRESAVGVVVEG